MADYGAKELIPKGELQELAVVRGGVELRVVKSWQCTGR